MNFINKIKTSASAVAIALATCAGAANAEQLVRLSTYVNEVDIRYEGFQHFADLVSEKTEGRVKIEIFPSATLNGWSEGIDAVLGGVADVSHISYDDRLPCYRAGAFYPASVDLENQIALDEEMTAILAEEAAKVGLVNIFSSNYSFDQEWWFQEQNVDLSNLNGLQVRSIGPLVSAMIEGWGGSPVFVSPKEVFQSAERGVVDGINMGVATYSSWKLWTVMPHMINADLFYGNVMYMMNKNKFDTLSPEDQQAIRDASREAQTWLKPRYEAWVNENVGDAVMNGGGSARSLTTEEKEALLASIVPQWDEELDNTCGKETADKIRALLAKHQQ
ncbi:C4-dicarboxylate ABC transporter substrate-binding protein [Leisingera sp. M658]|uniref:C4-dicarboxylate ABC transporter substrate-binding protein n=1 Tax=Leisingera sp. M658 TaxID=2867015 RepID=UPI0021A8F556|nr:C4-dicarboxylate ABC transporter substrate-binding protein [Leisingera sp. M658]UWQ75823.1 C4-dicarboxylate ABC transporter substrate-binding protein [Leisingera sp. M658]